MKLSFCPQSSTSVKDKDNSGAVKEGVPAGQITPIQRDVTKVKENKIKDDKRALQPQEPFPGNKDIQTAKKDQFPSNKTNTESSVSIQDKQTIQGKQKLITLSK